MNKNQLNEKHYLYGNKGSVWMNSVHIAKSGHAATLCGTPMLSNNWARILEIDHAGCPHCISAYNEANGYGDESPEEFRRMLIEVGIVK